MSIRTNLQHRYRQINVVKDFPLRNTRLISLGFKNLKLHPGNALLHRNDNPGFLPLLPKRSHETGKSGAECQFSF